MSTTHLQETGREAYKRGDYAKALELFGRAIGRGNPTPQLLDHLAATHLKLDDLRSALQAAKKAIHAGKQDPTGYLRAGVVLKKMEKPSVALEIYSHGLKQVKHVGKGYERLKESHDSLMKDLAPQKSVDPLSVLPRELALAVLEYLTFRQRVAICRVSKGWTKFIQSEPNLWTHLDLSGARANVKSSFITKAINRARSRLATATLNRVYDFDKVLSSLVQYTPMSRLVLMNTGLQGPTLSNTLTKAGKLKELHIHHGTDISENTLMQSVNALQSHLVVLYCAFVAKLDFRQPSRWQLLLPKLEWIHLTAERAYGLERFFDELTKNSPNLRFLAFHQTAPPIELRFMGEIDLRKCTRLEHVSLRLGFGSDHIQLPPSVRNLHLWSDSGEVARRFFTGRDASAHVLTMSSLPHLEVVVFGMPGLPFHHVSHEFSRTPHAEGDAAQLADLRSLTMENPCLTDFEFFEFGSRLSKLEHLALRRTTNLQDKHVEIIVQQLKSLRSLDLTGTGITGVSIRSITTAGQVKELVVTDCSNLSRDAIDLARSKGIKVEHKTTSQETGGRKVRY